MIWRGSLYPARARRKEAEPYSSGKMRFGIQTRRRAYSLVRFSVSVGRRCRSADGLSPRKKKYQRTSNTGQVLERRHLDSRLGKRTPRHLTMEARARTWRHSHFRWTSRHSHFPVREDDLAAFPLPGKSDAQLGRTLFFRQDEI